MRYTLCSRFVLCSFIACNCRGEAAPATTHAVVNEKIDSIVVVKCRREMQVYNHKRLLKVYHVCLGPQPLGPKHFREDGKTPEGIYSISGKNPNSHYHKCLGISYPSANDIVYARRFGMPAGGDIKIHGLPNGRGYQAKEFAKVDWTLGCIAIMDDEIDELYKYVDVGTVVNIMP